MGVRGLQSFLERFCSDPPEACYTVDLAKLIAAYNSRTGKPAVIVVDAQACYGYWSSEMDFTVGFEIQKFVNRLRKFVEAFEKVGAKLVFIFGGATAEKKRAKWLERRRVKLSQYPEIFDFLKHGNAIEHLPDHLKDGTPLFPNAGLTAAFVLKYILECEVHLTVMECDEEIVEYAQRNDCFAILSQDSDFIISNVNAVVLSVKHFNINSMTTKLYDRVQLARRLRIEVSQLPLFAILAGNDLVPPESLLGFHRCISGSSFRSNFVPSRVLFPALGQYIHRLPKAPIDSLLKEISQHAFGSTNQLDHLKMAYNSYMINPAPSELFPEDNWSHILCAAENRHRDGIMPADVFSIMNEQLFESSTAFEDLREIHSQNTEARMRPCATVTRPLRLRLYGVLLHEKKIPPFTVTEWCGENVNSFIKPIIVDPAKPIVEHPGLMALWSDDKSDNMVDIRWNLFVKSVSTNMETSKWRDFHGDLLLLTISLSYLYEVKYVNKSEVDAVAATLALYPLYNQKKLEKLSFGRVNLRAAHISFTLVKTYGYVLMLLAACGFPLPCYVPMSGRKADDDVSQDVGSMKFEGKLFQFKYKSLIEEECTYDDLCEDDTCMNVFYKIKKMVYEDGDTKR